MNRHHSLFFSLSVVVITLIIGCFLWCSNTNQKTSQNKILEAYRETQRQTESNIELFIKQSNAHRNELQSCVDRQMKLLTQLCNENTKDSLFMAGLFVQLGADIKILEEQNAIITKLSRDSLSRNYEAVMSSVLSEKMLELHLAKIEHEYTNITIWAAVLTIIFLIFSFFSLFKIEQSRKEIEDIKDKGEREIRGSIDNANLVFSSNNGRIQSVIDSYSNRLDDLVKEYKTKLNALDQQKEAQDE